MLQLVEGSDFCFWTGLGAEHGVMLCFPLREAGSRRLYNRLFRVPKTKNRKNLTEERVFTLQYLETYDKLIIHASV